MKCHNHPAIDAIATARVQGTVLVLCCHACMSQAHAVGIKDVDVRALPDRSQERPL